MLRVFSMKYIKTPLFIYIVFFAFVPLLWTNPLDPTVRANTSAEDYYNKVVECLQNSEWKKLVWHAQMLKESFPHSPLTQEVHYYEGKAFYEMSELERANAAFSIYLKQAVTPQFFDETIHYKFEIACRFQDGARRRLFHARRLPKWVRNYEKAIELFDEVITTMPCSELAALSLHRQGKLYLVMKKYDKSISSFETFIRRFPTHFLAPDSYLSVGEAYLMRCKKQYAADLHLDCAKINLAKFRAQFPTEPRLEKAERQIVHIENVMAASLLEAGEFYRKKKKWKAAALYYRSILKKYPNAPAARISKKYLIEQNLEQKHEIVVEKEQRV